jgi:anti-sigma B factor antagonist
VDRDGDFAVAIDTTAGAAVATVEGELDLATSPELERALAGVSDEDRLVIDLSACTFLDSTAIRVLTSRARSAEGAGGSVAVVVTDSGIRRVLEIASLDQVLELHEARESALG